MSSSVPSSSRMNGHSMPRLRLMGHGRATEVASQAVNNYKDVRAAARKAALTAVSHSHGGCQEMEICQIMFHDFLDYNELWIES